MKPDADHKERHKSEEAAKVHSLIAHTDRFSLRTARCQHMQAAQSEAPVLRQDGQDGQDGQPGPEKRRHHRLEPKPGSPTARTSVSSPARRTPSGGLA